MGLALCYSHWPAVCSRSVANEPSIVKLNSTQAWFYANNRAESPWWLVRKGRQGDAERSLRSLASSSVDVKPTLAVIIETDRLEQELENGSTYMDCFKRVNIRRTEIAVGVYSIQVISGIYLVGYATYFFTLAGLPTNDAFSMGVGFLALGKIWLL